MIRTLRPPPFCFTAVNGEPAEPCVSKFKQAPSDKVAMKIAQLVAEERPCWIYNRKCARMNLTDTTGKPFWQKFNKVGAPLAAGIFSRGEGLKDGKGRVRVRVSPKGRVTPCAGNENFSEMKE